MNSHDIRLKFLEFFAERGHRVVSSSPLVPPDDPTLLFTTAGMVQFKPLYSGTVELPYSRAVSVQKCLRAGGKGSDLENVGRTLRHHTFFEMLGNFSFGDYFKVESLKWSYEFSTKVVGLDPDRLYASVYEDDDEAWDIWVKEIGLPESRLVRLGAKDNFWGPAGDSGACGPCSEIYYDRGEQYGPGLTFQHATTHDDDPGTRYIEFWNNVFPQFDQQKDGTRLPLKNRGVDTGMSVERLACISQDCASLYETDVMTPIVARACEGLGLGDYSTLPLETRQTAHVIADHVRALTFVLAEGILPGNEGRGYVMRRLLRRAARYARRAGQEAPFLHQVVDTVVEVMGSAYPEIKEAAPLVRRILKAEEEHYAQTLGAGLLRLDQALARAGESRSIPGAEVFALVSTYGLPLDDIAEVAADKGYALDLDTYQTHVERHRVDSRHGAKGARFEPIYEPLRAIFAQYGKTEFLGYPHDSEGEFISFDDEDESLIEDDDAVTGKIVDLGLDRRASAAEGSDVEEDTGAMYARQLAEREARERDGEPPAQIWNDELYEEQPFAYPVEAVEGVEVIGLFRSDERVSRIEAGDDVAVVLNATNFYAESGGQVGDTGHLIGARATIRITDTIKTPEELFIHYGTVEKGDLAEGESLLAVIDTDRRWSVMRNHTATHLLQGALKTVIGKHITQQGSYVGPDYLRFDFTCPEAVSHDELAEVERLVNEQILRNAPVLSEEMDLEEARKTGAIAPFGERYGARVRVVNIPDWDVEFCGGTHLPATGSIGCFLIRSESAISSGVRRIEAVTGRGALEVLQRERRELQTASSALSVPRERITERIVALQEELKSLRRQSAQQGARESAARGASLLESAREIGGAALVCAQLDGLDGAQLREVYDGLKSRRPQGLVAVLASATEDRVALLAGVTSDLSKRLSASDLIKQAAPLVGGKGGGKPDLAQAGGKDPAGIPAALDAARAAAESALGA